MLTVANNYTYDHVGRKTQTFESINGGANILLSQADYNEVGQVMTKHLHGASGALHALQDIAYAYNERGWLNKINDPTVNPVANKLFGLQLNYNSPAFGATAQYNGNIAEQDYNAGISGRQHVVYGYDNLNRLLSGTGTAGYSETGISYDQMGNIQSLTRAGTSNGTLSYSYNGNQLTTLSGFKSGSYVYDLNGNVTTDGARAASIGYNVLNLPNTVTASGISIAYTYDAAGNKLRKVSSGSSTDYISGIQYKANGTIDFIQTEEGRAVNTGSGYNYEYTLTDQLGNNRTTFDNVNGKIGEDDYYPFGLNVHRLQNTGNNYLYNKKELQTELTEYDYGARLYDPVVGRWNVIDHFAEKSRRWSPYNYGENNPIRNIDLEGDSIISKVTQSYTKTANPTQLSDLGGTTYQQPESVISSTNANVIIDISQNYSAAFQGTTPQTNIERQNPGLENEVKTHENFHKDQIMAAANLPVSVTINVNGQAIPYNGTADKVILDATNAFRGSTEVAGMSNSQKTSFIQEKISTPALTQVDNNIVRNVLNQAPAMETDAINKTNTALGSANKYSNGTTPVQFNGRTLINDHQ